MGRPPARDLTERELEVMHVFWKQGEATAAEARDRLAAAGLDRTYTTIANLVRALEDKGFLHQVNTERPFVYRPARSYEEVTGQLLGDLLQRRLPGFAIPVALPACRATQADGRGTRRAEADTGGASLMNQLGIALGWLAIQVTLAMLPAIALHLVASRRGPVAGSWLAAAGLAMIVGISVLAIIPRPQFPILFVPAQGQSLSVNVSSAVHKPGDRQGSAADAPAAGHFLSLEQVHAIWQRVGSRLTLPAASNSPWPGIVAWAALIGMSWGLLRLLLGLWAVHECRRRAIRVDEADAIRLLESLKTAMHCDAVIELRELPDLGTPATAGWRRPMVLLPDDWRSWSENDRRAVLAHELAHIQRSDYIVGLLARLAVALHFYHPLVRWLAGRLQAQQELAADAVGVRFGGGRGPYLAVLSRMALGQDREISWWPARAFSPARGTLIRRIRMLRTHEESADRGWVPARRLWPRRCSRALPWASGFCPRRCRGVVARNRPVKSSQRRGPLPPRGVIPRLSICRTFPTMPWGWSPSIPQPHFVARAWHNTPAS